MPWTIRQDWYVHYRTVKAEHVNHVFWFNNCVMAIDAACSLVNDGCDVFSVGERSKGDTLSKKQIARVHTLRVTTKLH